MIRHILRRLTHRLVFKHWFSRAVLLYERDELPFTSIVCERCGYYDQEEALGLYVVWNAHLERVVAMKVKEWARAQ